MNQDQQAAFEAWYDTHDPRTPQSPFDRALACKAWQAALQSPEVQELRDALRNLYQAIDSCVELAPKVMRQAQAALAAIENQK